jgi:biotin carboxyl carrier protein
MNPQSTVALRATVAGESFDVRVGPSDVSISADGLIEASGLIVREAGANAPRTLILSPPETGQRPSPDHVMRVQVALVDDVAWVFVDGEVIEVEIDEGRQESRRRRDRGAHDALAAPMPATVTRILVEEGRHVARGDTLVLLEAMKMEMPIKAPHDGVITRLRCRTGELVQPGEPLVDMEST